LLAARRISLRSVICFGPFMLGGAICDPRHWRVGSCALLSDMGQLLLS
jgi:hypothetical protein